MFLQVTLLNSLLKLTVRESGATTTEAHFLSVDVIAVKKGGKSSESLGEKNILISRKNLERRRTEMRTSCCLHGYMESVNLAWNVSLKCLKEPLVPVKNHFGSFFFFDVQGI